MSNPYLYQSVGTTVPTPAPAINVNIAGSKSPSRSKLGVCFFFVFLALAGVVAFLGITGDLPLWPNGVDPAPPQPPPSLPPQYNHTVGPLLPLNPFLFNTSSFTPNQFAISPEGMWLYSLNTATGVISTYTSNFITGQLSVLNSAAYIANASNPSLLYISEGGEFLYLGFLTSPMFEVIEIDLYTGDLMGLATVQLSTGTVNAIYDNPLVIYTFVSDYLGNINIIFMMDYYFPLLVNTTNTGSRVNSMVCDSSSTWLYTLDQSYRIKQWLIANDSAPLQLLSSTALPTLPPPVIGWTQLQAQVNLLFLVGQSTSQSTIFIYTISPSSGSVSLAGNIQPVGISSAVFYLATTLFLYAVGTNGQQLIVNQYALPSSGSTISDLNPPSFVATTITRGNSGPFFILSSAVAQGVVYLAVPGNASILQFVIE